MRIIYLLIIIIFSLFILGPYSIGQNRNETTPTSMVEYERGDLFIFKEKSPQHIEIGDVVVVELEDSNQVVLVTHRVEMKLESHGEYFFIIKGDNPNSEFDMIDGEILIHESRIKGVVVYKMNGGIYLTLYNQPILLILLSILIGVLIIKQVSKEIKPKENEDDERNMIQLKLDKRLLLPFLSICIILMFILPVLFSPINNNEILNIEDQGTEITNLDGNSIILQQVNVTIQKQFSIIQSSKIHFQLYNDSQLQQPVLKETIEYDRYGIFSFSVVFHIESIQDCRNIFIEVVLITSRFGIEISRSIATTNLTIDPSGICYEESPQI